MNLNLTELVFILDRSGSMSGLESDTIGGFNSILQESQIHDKTTKGKVRLGISIPWGKH